MGASLPFCLAAVVSFRSEAACRAACDFLFLLSQEKEAKEGNPTTCGAALRCGQLQTSLCGVLPRSDNCGVSDHKACVFFDTHATHRLRSSAQIKVRNSKSYKYFISSSLIILLFIYIKFRFNFKFFIIWKIIRNFVIRKIYLQISN